MAANAKLRETTRDALAAGLSTKLTGVGNPVQQVLGYRPTDAENVSPLVVVLSNGSRRLKRGIGPKKYRTFFRFLILVFVADADAAAGWTDQNVEDTLDEIEKDIADYIADNEKTNDWNDLRHDPDLGSRILPAQLGGKSFQLEIIPVTAEVHDA